MKLSVPIPNRFNSSPGSLIEANATLSSYQAPYLLGAILACFLLVLAIQYGSGYYNYVSIQLLIAAVICSMLLVPGLVLAQISPAKTKKTLTFSISSMILFTTILLVLEVGLGLQDVYLHYSQIPLFSPFSRGVGWIIIGLLATYLLHVVNQANDRLSANLVNYRFPLIILLSVILKIVAVFASYINKIDVGVMMQQSSAYLLAGSNPYTSATAGYGGFNYLPLHLLLPLPFYILFGDTRFGSIAWELIGVGFIYHLAKKELSLSPGLLRLAELALLIFMLQPRGLFVVEQAWGEPLIVGVAAATLYFLYYKPDGLLAGILFAAMLAIKQYLVFMCLPLFILYKFDWKRYGTIALTFTLIILPFVIWNPFEFFNRNVLHFFRLPIQTDSLGLTAYFWEHGLLIPRWLSPILASLVSLGLSFYLRRFGLLGYLHTVILTFYCLFLFGQQAFANYYYLLSFFQVLTIIFFVTSYCARSTIPRKQEL